MLKLDGIPASLVLYRGEGLFLRDILKREDEYLFTAHAGPCEVHKSNLHTQTSLR